MREVPLLHLVRLQLPLSSAKRQGQGSEPHYILTMARMRVEQTIHVVPGARFIRGTSHVLIQDDLGYGPCALDPVVHDRRRADFWRALAGSDAASYMTDIVARLNSVTLPRAETRVVVWTSSAWSDRVVYWWLAWTALDRKWPRALLHVVDIPGSV